MATRRTLLGALVAGFVAPRLAFAQPARIASVVVLFAGESEDDEPATRSFFDEMRRLGWVEGTNITYERLEGRGEREYVEGLARSAAGRIPDLIYATTTSVALAVVRQTASIPVVFTSAARSEEHTSELQSRSDLVCRLLLEKKNINEEKQLNMS